MLFSKYQRETQKTAKYKNKMKNDLEISTTQLAYEAGSVLDAYSLFKDSKDRKPLASHLREELGDVLWYLANLARIFGLSLNKIAAENANRSREVYQEYYPSSQRLHYEANRIGQISYFQGHVHKTDVRKNITVSVLGLIGQVGSIATITKKIWRDSDGAPQKRHLRNYQEKLGSEIGDCLWYLASIAQNLNLSLETIAHENLARTKSRWLLIENTARRKKYLPDDSKYPPEQRFPRVIPIRFVLRGDVVLLRYGDITIGDRLTDNAYEKDYYRYHDVFHLAYMAVLGWSPVMRGLLKCKRKDDEKIDEVEDGARAAIIEETVANYIYQQSVHHGFFERKKHIDAKILNGVRQMTSALEIKDCPAALWERAIFEGFKVFLLLRKNNGGTVTVNIDRGLLRYYRPHKARGKHSAKRVSL